MSVPAWGAGSEADSFWDSSVQKRAHGCGGAAVVPLLPVWGSLPACVPQPTPLLLGPCEVGTYVTGQGSGLGAASVPCCARSTGM